VNFRGSLNIVEFANAKAPHVSVGRDSLRRSIFVKYAGHPSLDSDEVCFWLLSTGQEIEDSLFNNNQEGLRAEVLRDKDAMLLLVRVKIDGHDEHYITGVEQHVPREVSSRDKATRAIKLNELGLEEKELVSRFSAVFNLQCNSLVYPAAQEAVNMGQLLRLGLMTPPEIRPPGGFDTGNNTGEEFSF
jgi:hypothetical protein